MLEGALLDVEEILRENSKCAKLFGGADRAINALRNANIKYGDLGRYKNLGDGRFTGIAAGTNREANEIIINTHGGFLLGGIVLAPGYEPGQTVYVSVRDGLTATEYRAVLLLHELGHLLGPKIFGKNDDDVHNQKANEANAKKVRNACIK